MPHAGRQIEAPAIGRDGLAQAISRAAEPLPNLGEAGFAHAFDRFGEARVVLLGAPTEGTSEFHRARAAITRWLIEQRGFSIVALDADWTEARVFDAFVRGRETPRGADGSANFPAWRWRNAEVLDFLDGLRGWNSNCGSSPAAAVYGLDLYNLGGSMRAVIDYLDRLDPGAAEVARRRFGGLTPWADEPSSDGRLSLTSAYVRHEKAVTSTLCDVLARQAARLESDGVLQPAQARRLVAGAESHYQALYRGGVEAWNRRANVMLETLDGILARRGPKAKAVIWTHSAQAGDAAATDMGAVREGQSLGGLCRDIWGREAALIGFGTYSGAMMGARDWDAPAETRRLGPAEADSVEAAAHAARTPRFLLDTRPGRNEASRAALSEPRLQRFVGPVYRPGVERWSHYVEGRLAQQFDGWVWFDETHAVDAHRVRAPQAGEPEPQPWPFGL